MRWPPVNGNIFLFGNFLNMGVELIGQDTHDPCGDLLEPQSSEQADYAGSKKKGADIASQYDTVKAVIAELDIWTKLIEKGVARPVKYGFSSRRPEVYLTG